MPLIKLSPSQPNYFQTPLSDNHTWSHSFPYPPRGKKHTDTHKYTHQKIQQISLKYKFDIFGGMNYFNKKYTYLTLGDWWEDGYQYIWKPIGATLF